MGSTEVRYEVLPVANRLVLFWSDEECPHEVQATHRDRFAATVWFCDGSNSVHGPQDMAQLLKNSHPVAPLSVAMAMQRAGAHPSQADRLQLLHDFYTERRRSGLPEDTGEEHDA